MNIQKIWNDISDVGIELESDEEGVQYVRLLNQYIIIVFFVFFVHALHKFFYIKDMPSGHALMYLSMFFLLALLFEKLKRIKIVVFSVFILLILVIFFYESYSRGESGIYLYYFPLVLALPFIFDFKKDYIYMCIIVLCVLLSILVNVLTDYSLFTNDELSHQVKRSTTFVSASISGIIVIVDLIFIMKKNQAIHRLYEETMEKEILLAEKQRQLDSLSTMEKENIGKTQELIQLAVNNDPSFFSAFKESYPTFFPYLLKIEPNLSVSELEFCAYIKLGFSTKEIAQYLFISVRAVEGRKYRIRKKLNFSSGKELLTWMIELDSTKQR